MNSREINSGGDIRGRREEGQDYDEDYDKARKAETKRGQDYLDDEDGSGILNKVMNSSEIFH